MIKRFLRLMDPAGDEGTAGGSAVDRGDDWNPTAAEDAAAAAETAKSAKTAAALEAELDDADDEVDKEVDKDDDAKDGEEKPKAKAKDTRLPLARHQEILDRERERRTAVEAELAKYKQGAAIKATNADITVAEDNLLKMETDYQRLVADGESKLAADKMREIRQAERSINDARMDLSIQAAEARAVEKVRYDTTVERLEEAYPELNPDHADFDKAKVVDVMELKTAYQSMGHPPAAALQKAVKTLMPARTTKQENVVDTEARVNKDDVAAQLKKDRKAEAVKRNAEVAGKQPPDTKQVGLDSDKQGAAKLDAKDVMKLSQDDFRKLTDEELSKLRGDDL